MRALLCFAPCCSSPLDPFQSVSQYDWGGDALSGGDPLSSMLGDVDPDGQPSPGALGGLGVYMGPRRLLGPGDLFGEIRCVALALH